MSSNVSIWSPEMPTPDEFVKKVDLASTADGKGAAMVGLIQGGTGAVPRTVQDKLRETVSVKDFGAVGDGVTDDSQAIIAAHAIGPRVHYSHGVYLYTDSSRNPDFSTGVDSVNARVDGEIHEDIIRFDADGRTLVGMQHNHQEDSNITLGSNLPITSGSVVAPPLSRANIESPVDIVAHWYNDFGLEYTRSGNGANGGLTWYYWTWNHVAGGGYDPQRHPLMGFYRGDDANVLDWQCYWLREYGVNAVSLVPSEGIDVNTWSLATDKYHWLYQLFNNTPNFKGLRYMLWGKTTGTPTEIKAAWNNLIDNIYFEYENFYSVEVNGKIYPAIYVFEGRNLDTNLGNTSSAFITFATEIANKFKSRGYGGVALFVRHPRGDGHRSRRALEAAGVLFYSMDYGAHGAWLLPGGSGSRLVIPTNTTYEAALDGWTPDFAAQEWVSGKSYEVNDVCARRGRIWLCLEAHTSTADTCPGEGKSHAANWYRLNFVSREVCAVPTAKLSVAPHTSTGNAAWTITGSTPALFRKWMKTAIDKVLNTPGAARIIAIYNVAEWAEGGPGLQPNVQDGFGYLQALRDALTTSKESSTPVAPLDLSRNFLPRFVGPGSEIPSEFPEVRLSTDAARTMTSTPTIEPGVDGQHIRLMNVNSSYTITLQDNSTLSGSGLFLAASTAVLGPYDSIELQYIAGKGWVQIGNVVNVS